MARILVIEDSSSLCKLYKQELESEGHEVVIAEDAIQGLGAFETHHPDVVVLDIRMPAMDGLDMMQRILDRDRKTRVVLNSGYASYKDSFLSWTADAYLLKTSDTSELRSTIRNLMCGRRD